MERSGLSVGVKLKEVATHNTVYENVTVLHSDSIGLVFEVERTLSEGGQIENVVSQVLVPWTNIHHVLLVEERT